MQPEYPSFAVRTMEDITDLFKGCCPVQMQQSRVHSNSSLAIPNSNLYFDAYGLDPIGLSSNEILISDKCPERWKHGVNG